MQTKSVKEESLEKKILLLLTEIVERFSMDSLPLDIVKLIFAAFSEQKHHYFWLYCT